MKRTSPLLFLLLLLCLGAIPGRAQTFSRDGLNYRVTSTEERTVTLTGPVDKSALTGALEIPSTVQDEENNSYSVTSIGDSAFYNCSIECVNLPESLKVIGDFAFGMCKLSSVTIPNSVNSIGRFAFHWSPLTSVTIPNSVTSIGEGAFACCDKLQSFYGKFATADHRTLIVDGVLIAVAPNGLTSYRIPYSVTSIGDGAFYNCYDITDITIPYSVTSIGDNAFLGCTSLSSIIIPNTVTSIGLSAFHWCSSLTSVTIPESVTSIGDNAFTASYKLKSFNGKFASDDHRCLIVDGVLKTFANGALENIESYVIPNSVTTIGESAFFNCYGLTTLTLPNSVTTIKAAAFYACNSLISVVIPKSVTFIGQNAFGDCIDLKEIYMLPATPPAKERGFDIFEGVDVSGCTLYVPEEAETLYRTTAPWCDFGTIKTTNLNSEYALELRPEPLPQGKGVVMPLMLTNPEQVVTVQFDLFLPEGITLDKDEYGDFIITPGERCNSTHVFSSGAVGECIRVVGYSNKNRPYSDDDAPLLYLPLSAAADVEPGQFLDVEIRNISVTRLEGLKEVKVPASRASIEIIEPYIPGDVNNDGYFSATDISHCLALILGQAVEGSIPEAADVNKDGSVTSTDIAMIVALILADGTQDATAMEAPAIRTAEADASPAYYINPLTVEAGQTATLEVGLRNPGNQAVTMQCDIFLPDGVEVETDEYGDPVIDLAPGRSAGHTILTQRVANGAYRVVSYSDRNRPYKGTDGVIFTMPLIVKAPAGEYTVRLQRSLITEAGTLREIPCPDTLTSSLSIAGNASSINGLDAEGEEAEYFTLQGVRVDANNLVPDIYIRRVGGKVSKVVVR